MLKKVKWYTLSKEDLKTLKANLDKDWLERFVVAKWYEKFNFGTFEDDELLQFNMEVNAFGLSLSKVCQLMKDFGGENADLNF